MPRIPHLPDSAYGELITGDALKAYFLEHARPIRSAADHDHLFEVTKDLNVFKKVRTRFGYGVVNLTIPVGAKINVGPRAWDDRATIDERKMRASEALVHSVRGVKTGTSLKEGWSDYAGQSFKYRKGETVTPTYGFSDQSAVCSSGIHFFLNLRDARDYSL